MQKKIVWPEPFKLSDSVSKTAQDLLLEVVMATGYWRESFERVDHADLVCTELEKGGPASSLPAHLHATLLGAMKLEGQTLSPPAVNRYYFKVLKAAHKADDVE